MRKTKRTAFAAERPPADRIPAGRIPADRIPAAPENGRWPAVPAVGGSRTLAEVERLARAAASGPEQQAAGGGRAGATEGNGQ